MDEFIWHSLYIITCMVVYNYAVHHLVPEKYHLWLAGALSGAIIWWGLQVLNLTRFDLGIAAPFSGLLYGLGFGVGLSLFIAAAAKNKRTKNMFNDTRVIGVRPKHLLKRTLIDIPITTVLFEEVLFRGLVLGYFLTQTSYVPAMLYSSLLFGLWHILPALKFTKTNQQAGSFPLLSVIGTVIFTGITGIFFAWLRIISGSLLAPMMIHFIANSGGYLASWLHLNGR